jgi:hypothetical protein
MLALPLKKLVSPFFLTCLFAAFAASQVLPRSADAFMAGPYGVGCGTMCMAYGGTMFSPFAGTPWLQMTPGYGYGTGQMMVDPRTMIAQQLAWNGAQPMGYSYLPPIGLSAIQDSMAARAWGF